MGLLVDEAAESPHAIDFLHPRKRPAPPNNTRRNVLVAIAALAACAALIALVVVKLIDLDKEIAAKRVQTRELKEDVEAAEVSQRHQSKVQEFVDSDITWLDELSDLSEQLPPAEDIIVTQLNFATRTPAGAQIIVDGFAKESEQVTHVRDSLRSGGRSIISMGEQDDPRGKEYHWLFKETVLIEPGEEPRPRSTRREEEPPAATHEETATSETAADAALSDAVDESPPTNAETTPQTAAGSPATDPESQTR